MKIQFFSALVLAGALIVSDSSAQPTSSGSWHSCWANFYQSRPFTSNNQVVRLVNDAQFSRGSSIQFERQWKEYAATQGNGAILGGAYCRDFDSQAAANSDVQSLRSNRTWRGAIRSVNATLSGSPQQASSGQPARSTATMPSTGTANAQSELERHNAEVRRRNQQAQADYRRRLESYNQNQARHSRNAGLADQAMRQHAQEVARVRAMEEEYRRQMEQYRRNLATHTNAVSGNRNCRWVARGERTYVMPSEAEGKSHVLTLVPAGARNAGTPTCQWFNGVIGEPRRTDFVKGSRGYICQVSFEVQECSGEASSARQQ